MAVKPGGRVTLDKCSMCPNVATVASISPQSHNRHFITRPSCNTMLHCLLFGYDWLFVQPVAVKFMLDAHLVSDILYVFKYCA